MLNFGCFLLILLIGLMDVNSMVINKRSEKTENNLEKPDQTEYPMKVNYDVYPLVFPKRAAMLLDRLMVALHHALEDEDPKEIKKINELYRNGQFPIPMSPINSNPPKYFKGKSERDAYYGYKLINGQTDESENMGGKSMELGVRAAVDYDQDLSGDELMDLQRRGQNGQGHSQGLGANKGRVYWRCYFNAVTCF